MGIPSYFSLIIRKYKRIITDVRHVLPDDIHHLFMDCNSIIYDAYHEQLKINEETRTMEMEQILCVKVVQKIDEYIRLMQPINTVYIAFDGVAPMAKMKQQRIRRCKGVYWAQPGSKPYSPETFLLSSITPGTLFMTTLMSAIRSAFAGKEDTYSVKNLVVSTSEEPGEGEHKIFQYIRSMGAQTADDVSIVYGLDADLIMLSL